MFMRYTHYGVGHPTVLRELTKACADVDPAEEDENDDEEWERDIRSRLSVDGDEGGQEDDNDEEAEEQGSDEEEDEDEEEEEEEIGEDVDDEADEDDDNMLSF
jgi:hypothetical protein